MQGAAHPALADAGEELLPLSKLGPVKSLLGRGGWGSVYKATYGGKPIALKVRGLCWWDGWGLFG